MLTNWLARQGASLTRPPLRLSDEARRLVRKYAPTPPELDRQIREGTLIAAYAVSLVGVVAVWGILGWLASTLGSPGADEIVFWVGCAVLVGLLTGMALHLLRYYDALISRRSEWRTPDQKTGLTDVHAWPRGSSDADFILQLGVSICVLMLGVLR